MEVNEPAVAYSKRKYSIEEYLEMENNSIEKHEYYKGELFAMAGNKSRQNIITRNIFLSLGMKLKGKSCQPFGSDLRIHIKKNTLFTYPDISVICGELISLNNDDLNFLNPSVIFEILSPSTRDYDSNEKFRLYRDIPTLREYILVDTDTISIEAFYLTHTGIWQRKTYNSADEILILSTIQVTMELKDIYENATISNISKA